MLGALFNFLFKIFFHPLKETFIVLARIRFEVRRVLQFFQQFAFLAVKGLRCPYVNMNQLVAAMVRIYFRYAFALQAQNASALCTGLNLNLGFTVDGGYLNVGTLGCINKADVQVINDIIAIAF